MSHEASVRREMAPKNPSFEQANFVPPHRFVAVAEAEAAAGNSPTAVNLTQASPRRLERALHQARDLQKKTFLTAVSG
jgi:hypothetical protein